MQYVYIYTYIINFQLEFVEWMKWYKTSVYTNIPSHHLAFLCLIYHVSKVNISWMNKGEGGWILAQI